MSQEYGCSHVWGIPITQLALWMRMGTSFDFGALEADIIAYIQVADALDLDADAVSSDPALIAKVRADREAGITPTKAFHDRLQAAFELANMKLPETDADLLHWTGNGEDRPGRCQARDGMLLIGFGMFRDPTSPLPRLDPRFVARAEHFHWVSAF